MFEFKVRDEGGGFENEAMMEENGCLSLRLGTKVVTHIFSYCCDFY